MNLAQLHIEEKEVSAISLFNGEEGSATALRIKAKGILKEHITKTPALLLCISGKVIYKDEDDKAVTLLSGDYVAIQPAVKHWIEAEEASHLVLLK